MLDRQPVCVLRGLSPCWWSGGCDVVLDKQRICVLWGLSPCWWSGCNVVLDRQSIWMLWGLSPCWWNCNVVLASLCAMRSVTLLMKWWVWCCVGQTADLYAVRSVPLLKWLQYCVGQFVCYEVCHVADEVVVMLCWTGSQCVCWSASPGAIPAAGDGPLQHITVALATRSGAVGTGPRPDATGQVLPTGEHESWQRTFFSCVCLPVEFLHFTVNTKIIGDHSQRSIMGPVDGNGIIVVLYSWHFVSRFMI